MQTVTPCLSTLGCAAMLLMGHAQAETPAVRVTASPEMPQVTQIDGRTFAWNNNRLKAELPWLVLEAKVPSCLSMRAVRATSCLDGSGDVASRVLGRKFSARLRDMPQLPGGIEADFVLRGWTSPNILRSTTSAARHRSNGGEADIELSRDLGPVQAYVGHTEPLAIKSGAERWKSDYAGAKWRIEPGQSLELGMESGQRLDRAERDRQITLRYDHTRTQLQRLSVGVIRQIDTPDAPWRASVSLQWRL